MSKLVVLELDGTFEQGFRITLEIYREDVTLNSSALLPARLKSRLPQNSELPRILHQHWQEKYRSLGAPYRRKTDDRAFRIKPQKIVHRKSRDRQIEECRLSARKLGVSLNQWLNSEEFAPIEKQLRSHLQPEEEIRFLIRTEDRQLQKLPWQEWDLFQHYPRAETALSPPELKVRDSVPNVDRAAKVRILAILGHDEGIDTQRDRQLLEALPHAEVIFLVRPQRSTVVEQIWENAWDIIFFAGHSETEGETGRIYLNESESLSIDELWFGLKKAVDRGLQLAIFNSCDGLGLSDRLDDLQIPQMIVMRELVPDLVAQKFLTHFLRNFSAGHSFYSAVRAAKQRLHDELDSDFPCASWLPVICQTPNSVPPIWEDLYKREVERVEEVEEKQPQKTSPFLPILLGLGVAGLIMGVRSLGWLQGWELNHFDFMLRSRPAEPRDDRFLLVTIGENDLAYQDNLGMNRRDSLSPEALELFWQKVKPHQPRVVALNIHDFAYDSKRNADLLQYPHFLVSCHSTNQDSISISPPSIIPLNRVGFSNLIDEPDDIIRRQIIAKKSSPLCNVSHGFSLEIAQHYLQKEASKITPDRIQLGDITFDRLTPTLGGYQLSQAEAAGFQILINYRAANPQEVSLTDIISGARDAKMADLVRDKIILIGRDRDIGRVYPTPYSKSEGVASTIIHAQMASQLISAELDQRPLLKGFSQIYENILILFGVSIGVSFSIWQFKNKYKIFILCSAIGLLFFVEYKALMIGFWLPLLPVFLGIILTPILSFIIFHSIQNKQHE